MENLFKGGRFFSSGEFNKPLLKRHLSLFGIRTDSFTVSKNRSLIFGDLRHPVTYYGSYLSFKKTELL